MVAPSAYALTLDFEGFAAGTKVTNQFAGALISANNPNKSFDDAILFDTQNITGGDSDLATGNAKIPTNYGMVLIISENNGDANNDGIIDNPDDEGRGGSMMVKYDRVYTGGKSVIIDTEEEGSIDFYLDGNLVNGESVTINGIADGTAQVLSWDGFAYDEVHFNLAGSGALGELEAVPEPATMAIFGLGAAALAARRKRKA